MYRTSFFTVYGPWGRPDMATFIFTKKILERKEIQIFNNGNAKEILHMLMILYMEYIGAIVLNKKFFHKVYNLGNNKPELLINFIDLIELNLKLKAKKKFLPIQPGDVKETFADISESTKDLKFSPKIKLKGIPKFIDWYKVLL